ncbi:VanZ family protein [Bacillus sp. RG28]|uniref:VanZ family protein n=1 Tax=Gottfriedia endophytica TaxID=2820819 RepID=A0A940NGD2_9BACI|nr:VanZ family protein [Gottfriedia endophytica]MBP0723730.1 VanZ family protein [Gottfriedia endophytica]
MKLFFKIILFLLFCFYLFVLTQKIMFKFPLKTIIFHLDTTIDYINTIIPYHHFTFKEIGNHWRSINLIPFKTISIYLFADINFNIRIENIAGNIIGFMPFGFILPLLSKRFFKFKTITVATFSLSLTYELIQLVFGFGIFDVDDLILNTLGGMLGYFSIKIIYLIVISTMRNLKRVSQLIDYLNYLSDDEINYI